jgi:hypothetical protein
VGNWNINNIQGVGSHHNGADYDADRLARELVEQLKAKGHDVEHASFTYGAKQDLIKSS